MIHNVPSSLMGRSYWKKVSKLIGDRQDRVFLLPVQNDYYSSIVVGHLEEYYEFHRIRKMLVLVEDGELCKTVGKISNDGITIIKCGNKDVRRLLNYYIVNNFDERFVVASLEFPATRKVIESMIGCKGVTAEQIICRAIMHLPQGERE